MTQGDYEVPQGRIREERDNIRCLEDELVQGGILPEQADQVIPALTATDSLALRSIGSILHDFHNAAESIFEVIARDIDGSLPTHADGHRSLLTQMSLPLNTRRPCVLRKETVAALDEFRAFRHVFRNVFICCFEDSLRLQTCWPRGCSPADASARTERLRFR